MQSQGVQSQGVQSQAVGAAAAGAAAESVPLLNANEAGVEVKAQVDQVQRPSEAQQQVEQQLDAAPASGKSPVLDLE